jgi:flavin-dependent dehydrogenase
MGAGVPGLLLAGDVAGFIDPMTGDGLRFAVRGGEQAALAARRALENGNRAPHVDLLAERRREFSGKWRFNRTVRALVASPAVVRTVTGAAPVLSGLLQRLIGYAGDVSVG